MNLIICKDYTEMSQKAAAIAAENINPAEEQLVSFPSGDTPLGMINVFVEMVNNGKVDISRTRFVQLDEWVSLGEQDNGSCIKFIKDNLLEKLHYPFFNCHLIDGMASEIKNECIRLDSYIEHFGPMDLCILGIGLNGHLGLNEEGVDVENNSHIVPLSETTKKVMGKYFDREYALEYGITMGLKQIMSAKTVILVANGVHKASILKKALSGPVTNAVPASILQQHGNCYAVIDAEAAKEIK